MADEVVDLPEAAGRRFSSDTFTSGLSVADFAACLEMGLEPVGYVQGFCVMQWGYSPMGMGLGLGGGMPSGGPSLAYGEDFQCPHGFRMGSTEHRSWGQNYQQWWIEQAWSQGFSAAATRMLEEAQASGAHGVIGVVDSSAPLGDLGVLEFHTRGTAVRIIGADPPPDERPWTTYLAGQRLAKVIEAGLMPVSIAASIASVRVWAYCVTEMLMGGMATTWGAMGPVESQDVVQVSRARSAARRIARESIRSQLEGDSLMGADLSVVERDAERGDQEIQCILRGNRVRRFKEFDPIAAPTPTVTLR
jgi:hypothetical protein